MYARLRQCYHLLCDDGDKDKISLAYLRHLRLPPYNQETVRPGSRLISPPSGQRVGERRSNKQVLARKEQHSTRELNAS